MGNKLNNKFKNNKMKIVNRVKFITGDNNIDLEKKINRFFDEACGNFAGAPRTTPYTPSNDGVKTVFMALIEYSIKIPNLDEEASNESSEVEAN